MARPREFDERQAVEQAMAVFWRYGYGASSMERLQGAMGLSKSSLYETFGSKRELLDVSLDRYHQFLAEGPLAPLMREGAGRAEIEETLRLSIARALTPEGRRGCLVNNCLAEVGPHDPHVMERLGVIVTWIEAAFLRAIERGQRDGTITRNEPARALTRFVLNTQSGLNLRAKARPKKNELEDIVRVALKALD